MTVASLKSRVDSAPIPAARKADIRPKISVLQNQVRKLQKKIAEENVQKAVKVATEAAEVAASNGKVFCISRVDVGLDAAAVQKVLEKKLFCSHQLGKDVCTTLLEGVRNLCIVPWVQLCCRCSSQQGVEAS